MLLYVLRINFPKLRKYRRWFGWNGINRKKWLLVWFNIQNLRLRLISDIHFLIIHFYVGRLLHVHLFVNEFCEMFRLIDLFVKLDVMLFFTLFFRRLKGRNLIWIFRHLYILRSFESTSERNHPRIENWILICGLRNVVHW